LVLFSLHSFCFYFLRNLCKLWWDLNFFFALFCRFSFSIMQCLGFGHAWWYRPKIPLLNIYWTIRLELLLPSAVTTFGLLGWKPVKCVFSLLFSCFFMELQTFNVYGVGALIIALDICRCFLSLLIGWSKPILVLRWLKEFSKG
jgi:hypothetical protein